MAPIQEESQCPVSPDARHAFVDAATTGNACPIHHDQRGREKSSDGAVKDDTLSPLNAMPPPDQTRAKGQADALSTDRAVSSIPRAPPAEGTALPKHQMEVEEETWVYPSQQMFYNAMKRKGWNPEEETMPAIIGIHNEVNERAWKQIMAYEELHAATCCEPKLARFRGRFNDPTPKARFMSLLGFTAFDRHDWIVNRCGEEVRYVIDYYSAPGQSERSGSAMDSTNGTGVHIDARPALDSASAAVDRLRMGMRRLFTNLT